MHEGTKPVTTDSDTDKSGQGGETRAEQPSLFGRIRGIFEKKPEGDLIAPTSEAQEIAESGRVAWENGPFTLILGDIALQFFPDIPITGDDGKQIRDWVVHNGDGFYDRAPRFIRVAVDETVLFGRREDAQKRLFKYNKSVAGRHVEVTNFKGELSIKRLDIDYPTRIAALELNDDNPAIWTQRYRNLMRLPEVLGHPLKELDADKALEMIGRVNDVMSREAYRERDDDGNPGGVIAFPDKMTVIMMGDIHTRADNILRVLTEGGMLDALEREEVALVFLGDLVHSEEMSELENMESSVFILDLFTLLKLRFPKNVFYIRGNHESFSPDVGKGGVPQGILLRKHLRHNRSKAYAAEVKKLFDSLAFVVVGKDFAACHGAPVRSKVTLNTLVNIQRYPGIQYELVWNRLRQGNRPAGYGKGSVRRFRQTLGLSKQAAMIVAHTPLSMDETVWMDIGAITGHHLVYSAHTHRVAAMLLHNGNLTPLEFIPEPSLAVLNGETEAAAG